MRVPRRLRPLLRTIVPNRFRTLRGQRWRRRVEEATDKLWDVSGGQVLDGPFRGMRYVRSGYSQLGPKLLGTYEMELTPALERLLQGRVRWLVNVGAGEGYFACGFLRTNSDLRAVAFEASAEARSLLRDLAEATGVSERLEIRGLCDRKGLREVLANRKGERIWVFMDIEGGERRLLDPESVPGLVDSTVVVETHEFAEPGETEELLARFARSHRIRRIPARERTPDELPKVEGMSTSELLLSAFERSAEDQEWLWMRPLP